MTESPETGEAPAKRRASVRVRTAACFAATILAGAASGLLFGLLWVRLDADPVPVTPPPAVGWPPPAYRCGVVIQPEDLDRDDCAVSTR
jgi:hypothetical protein